MKKSTVIKIVALLLTGGVAVDVAYSLVDHNVGVSVTLTAVASVVASGLFLMTRLVEDARAHVFTCRTEGCAVSIRAWRQPSDELARLRELATDHARHIAAN